MEELCEPVHKRALLCMSRRDKGTGDYGFSFIADPRRRFLSLAASEENHARNRLSAPPFLITTAEKSNASRVIFMHIEIDRARLPARSIDADNYSDFRDFISEKRGESERLDGSD